MQYIILKMAPRRVLVPLQVGFASLKGKAPDKLSGTIHRKNKTKTEPLPRFGTSRILTASVNIPLLAAYEQARPTGYTPCELAAFVGNASHYASHLRCAHGAICAVSLTSKLVDSAWLDYVAFG